MSYKLRLTLIANFLFLLLIIENSVAQDMHKVDSLKALLETAKEDTSKVTLLNSIAFELNSNSPDSAMLFAWNAHQLAEKIKFPKGKAESYQNIGISNEHKGNYDKAMEYYLTSLKIYQEIFNKKGIGDSYNNIGVIYDYKGKYDKAMEYYLASLKIYEEIGNQAGIATLYNNIGIIYRAQGMYDNALKNYFASLKIKKEINNKLGIASSYNSIGITYAEQLNYEKALEYFFNSLKISEEIGDKDGMKSLYNNISEIYLVQKKYDNAIKYILISIKIRKQLGDKNGIATSYLNIGSLYTSQNKITEAQKQFHKSLNIAKEIGAMQLLKANYKMLSFCDSILGNWKNAYEYHKLYTAVKDSIFNEESTKNIAEMQTKYETEKKEKEIEVLTKDNELQVMKAEQQDDQIKKQWLLIIGIVFILGLAFSLMYVIYSQFKFKKAANEELELNNRTMAEINKELDKKNKNVADSINYAQRIQETIMPTQNQLQKLFPESFIFYKAKDVVSGDFPWVWSSNGSTEGIYVSAVDCTGHGVPGAMMSMIGYFLLNEIVNDRKIHQPSEILNHLHEGIKHTLRQEENLESQDGMDIALCNIRKNQMEVQFAGAHRPMLWLHNGEIIELKGNRFPIGGLQYSSKGKEIKFTNHILKLEKGDSIYFYSDGLVDQISSESGKRFKNDKVKKIILENQNKSMQEIRDIMNEEFNKWMGSNKQLDDVLMVGIRM